MPKGAPPCNKPDFLFVTCANGSEELLAEECVRILGPTRACVAGRGGVMVDESVENAMRLNLRSRIAQRVLWPMVDGDYRDEHDLYDLGRRINWSEWITPDETIRVDVTAQRSPLQSLNFAALRIKDAVCDVMREHGRRAPQRRHALSRPRHQPARRPDARLDRDRPERRGLVQARLARAAGRGAAEGDAGRPRCSTPPAGTAAPKTAACWIRAAAPAPSPSRPRRSPATSRRA